MRGRGGCLFSRRAATECSPGRKPGVGVVLDFKPRRGERIFEIFRTSGADSFNHIQPRACARGYTLTPLRGCFLFLFLTLFPLLAHAQDSPAPLTLPRVVNLYLERNLELEAARYRLERTKADQIAARLRPNPGLTVTAENFVLTGPTPFSRLYEVATSYSETIELGGKRKLRERA